MKYGTLAKTLVGALLCAAAHAASAAYPERPIRLVMPVAPSGALDATIRLLENSLRKTLGQPVIVDYKPGAAGMITAQAVQNAPADGYTIGLLISSMVPTPLVQKSSRIDLIKDLAPVCRVAIGPMVIFTRPDPELRTLDGLLAAARKHPDQLTYASNGVGSQGHLLTERLAQQAGVKFTHVPYKTNAQSLSALLAGDIHFTFTSFSEPAIQAVAAGKLHAIAVSTKDPSPALPGVPPVASLIPGFDLPVWYGIVAPRETPPAVVSRLSDAFRTALADPEIGRRYLAYGYVPAHAGPAELGVVMGEEMSIWEPMIKAGGFAAE